MNEYELLDTKSSINFNLNDYDIEDATYFVVTAISDAEGESDYSNEVFSIPPYNVSIGGNNEKYWKEATSAIITTSGDTAILYLSSGVGVTKNPISWTINPDTFQGISRKDGSIYIPKGEQTSVNISVDTMFIDVNVGDNDDLNITLYNMICEKNRVDKTDYLSEVAQLYGYFRDEVDVLNPVIIIESGFISANYCYINKFGRYYFITNVRMITTTLCELYLHVDVLNTYKTGIRSLQGVVERQEYRFNSMLIDDNYPVDANMGSVRILEIGPNIMPDESENTRFYIVQIFGGNDS